MSVCQLLSDALVCDFSLAYEQNECPPIVNISAANTRYNIHRFVYSDWIQGSTNCYELMRIAPVNHSNN